MQESWYHGHISYLESEKRLQGSRSGSFLVRESASHEGCYSIDVKHKRSVKHFLVQKNNWDKYEVTGAEKSFKTLPSLVTYYSSNILSAEGEMLHTPCPPPRKLLEPSLLQSHPRSSSPDSTLITLPSSIPTSPEIVEGMHNALQHILCSLCYTI